MTQGTSSPKHSRKSSVVTSPRSRAPTTESAVLRPPSREAPAAKETPPAREASPAKEISSVKEVQAARDAPPEPRQQEANGIPTATAPKAKSEKELEKERKKAEKAKKFAEKQAKSATTAAAAPAVSKTKEKKAKADAVKEEPLPEYVEETVPGEKKILKPLDDEYHKAYNPKVVESAWYAWWEKQGFYEPKYTAEGEVQNEGYFEIPLPPPNVTGNLHIGHALANSLQDTLIRWNRMLGKTTLWLPGCDHAGISTQSVVENMLWRRERKTRHDLGREKMTALIWNWKDEYHRNINRIQRLMGGSFDWSREAFTMDDNLSAAVTETFVRLHEEGVIYRSTRLVNWCVKLNTALSNLEVDNKELEGRTLLDVPGYDRKVEFGVLTYFKYPIEGTKEAIEVATTRPETMLGDTGIAVHPKDERYRHLVGKKARHPFVDRLLPVFADEAVDPEFGTGAVKITPAHDHNDFAMGERHKLEFVNILTDNGTLNQTVGPDFEGMKRFDARYKVIEKLKEKGLYVKWENNPMKVPLCGKSKDVIEPIIKPQWYMRMRGLADAAMDAVRSGEIKIRPESAEKNYFTWMENITDWCLSRQLWWGHQAPAYFVEFDGEPPGDTSDGTRWVCGRTEAEAQRKAEAKYPDKKFTLTRDPDVLDTWFSSGLWPFSTLGWPKETHDFQKLYPTSVLETGWDILFFWVARMIMLGIKMTGKVPFTEVYCHSLVRDSEGRKMSKSLGNVIDPLDIIQGVSLQALHDKLLGGNLDPKEIATATKFQRTAFPDGIPECGADALRFSLVSYQTGGGDIAFDVKVMHGYRRFCNKIYQATKYVLSKLSPSFTPLAKPRLTGRESLAEKWILSKLATATKSINQQLEDREFSDAASTVYQFWYTQLCDVYIENSKALISSGTPEEQESATQTLYTTLEAALCMIHPFMPFLTEELWQRLPRRPGDTTPSIVVAKYPTSAAYGSMFDEAAEEAYELILGVSRGIRSLVANYPVKADVGGQLYVQCFDATSRETCARELASIKSLSGKGVDQICVLDLDVGGPGSAVPAKPRGCVPFAVSAQATVYLLVHGRVDLDEEIAKASRKLERARDVVARQRKILDTPGYRDKVVAKVQETEREKLRDAEKEVEEMQAAIEMFEKLKLEE